MWSFLRANISVAGLILPLSYEGFLVEIIVKTIRITVVCIACFMGCLAVYSPLYGDEVMDKAAIEEIEYTEYGMSQRLSIRVRSDRTYMRRPDLQAGGGKEKEIERPTIPSHWQKLCREVDSIGVAAIVDVEPPSNGRAADSALYARISVLIGGEWFRSKYFDDNRPPEILKTLDELLLANRYKSTKGPE